MHKDFVTLKQITAPIIDDIKIFQQEFENALKSEVRLINSISKYMIRNRGKNIRPILTILSARLCGEPTLNSYRAAAMMELLHIATLIHDDVVDDATMRRGKPSINQVWKNKISVLMGDFILSKALINMIGIKDFDALERISSTAEKLSAGEILQIEKSITKSMTEDVYFDMINQKTASLIATSCELGAITTTKAESDRQATFDFGENLGMAFQIKDDLFDYTDDKIGKPTGIDIKEKKMTLPLIYTLNNCSKKEKNWIINSVKKYNKDKKRVKEIIAFVKANGGIEYTHQKMHEYKNKAIEILNEFPDSTYKSGLLTMIDYVVDRKI